MFHPPDKKTLSDLPPEPGILTQPITCTRPLLPIAAIDI